MGDLNFSTNPAERREPSTAEMADGFPCNEADRKLFNWLFWCFGQEILSVLAAADITPSNASHTQLLEAIQKLIPPNIDTNTFLTSVNGNATGGIVQPDSNNRFNFRLSNGRNWTLQLPEQQAIQHLNNPINILVHSQDRSSGNFDTGNVNLNLNSLSGVTVPQGAKGVILQAATSVSGNQSQIAQSNGSTLAFAWILAGGTLSSANFTRVAQVSNMVSYADTNLGGDDNDNTSYPSVRINGTNLQYRAKVIFSNTSGVDTGVIVLRLVAFTF